MKGIFQLSFVLFLLLHLSSCSTHRDTAMIIRSLQGSEWIVEEIKSKPLNPANYESRGLPTMTFLEDGEISGNTGCNQYRATYKINGSEIGFKPNAMTKRFCRGVDEDGFVDALTTTSQIENKGDKLIFSDNGTELMKLNRKSTQ